MLISEMPNEELECEIERLKRMHLQTITEIVGVVTNLNRAFLGESYECEDSVEDMLNNLCELAEEANDQYYEVVTALFERDNRERGIPSS
jgi:hypothetical protein